MNRRTMIAGLAAVSAFGGPGRAEVTTQPYRVSLIGGARDSQTWRAGVAIDLDEGWKTYWRMPGEAGIPPQFDWSASKGIAHVTVLYPLPMRLQDLSGETVGYERHVVFPLVVKPLADGKQSVLQLKLFLAVCKNICIPAKAQASLALGSNEPSDTEVLDNWLKRVPAPGNLVSSVAATMDGDKPVLVVKLARPTQDIFVEAKGASYFRKPEFSDNGLEARLLVDNVKGMAELKGLKLNLTLAVDGSGIEQSATVD